MFYRINVSVRRLGGGFGAKLHKAAHSATAASVAAHITRRPVRIVLSLEDNMEMIGKRNPSFTNYQVEFDTSGVIKTLMAEIYNDSGYSGNESKSTFEKFYMQK
jgi:xanthine dehydrogenase/oxidase